MKNLKEKIKWSGISDFYVIVTFVFIVITIIGSRLYSYWGLAMLPVFTIFLFAYGSRNSKKSRDIINLLYEDCNPAAFIDAWERCDKAKKNNRQTHLVAQVNISLGYFYKGEIERGISCMLEADKANTIEKPFWLSYTIYHNLAYMYLFDDQLDKAQLYIDKQKQLIAEELLVTNKNPNKIEAYKKMTELLEKIIDIKENRLDGLLEYFQKNMENSRNKLNLVSGKYYLFLLYEKLQNQEGQYECMEFIKENGNHLFLRSLANNWLQGK